MKHDLPGFSVGVIHDQELLWSKGYGYADVTNKIPATDQTLYRVASITKTFTAAAIMQLVEQGKLSRRPGSETLATSLIMPRGGNLAIFYRDFSYSTGLVKLGTLDSDVDARRNAQTTKATIELIEE